MTIDHFVPIVPGHASDYRFAWIFGFVLAALAAPLVVIFRHNAPWVIAIPIAFGALVIFLYEFRAAFGAAKEADVLVTIPSGFSGMMSYDQLLTLEIRPRSKEPK